MVKLKDVGTLQQNSKNKQYIFCLRSLKLKKLGMTPQELFEMTILEPKKFVKK